MKLKKAAAAVLAVLLCTAFCLPASAEAWTAEDYSFTIPEEFVYVLTPTTSTENPVWALAGISDPSSTLQEYGKYGIVADLYTEDGETNIQVMQKSADETESIFTLKDLDEEKRQEVLGWIQSNNDQTSVESSYLDVNGQPFYRFYIDSVTSTEDPVELHELLYGTIVNGHTLNFDMHSEGKPLSEEQVSLLESIVSSVQITQVLEKPTPEPLNVPLVIGLLVLAVAILIAPFIYFPMRNKLDKKQKAKMANRLSEYRKTHGEGTIPGEARFVNETECTREAIHAFSLYHAYGKNIGSLLLGAALCVVTLAVAFLFDMVWWLKLLVAGIAVYFVYRIISMPGNIEKVQRKVFSRGVSSTARYTFYDDGFRVGGIQSASLYPYFQITAVRRKGQYLYLYYGPDNAYLVDQYGFSLGEFEDFVTFIREKTGK